MLCPNVVTEFYKVHGELKEHELRSVERWTKPFLTYFNKYYKSSVVCPFVVGRPFLLNGLRCVRHYELAREFRSFFL